MGIMDLIFQPFEMDQLKDYVKSKFNVSIKLVLIYVVVYGCWGLIMDRFGTEMEIARFTHWWQVITVYLIYMIPISLLLKGLPFHMQYAYGLIAMGLLEFGGYALQTSYAYPENMLDHFFGIRNFSLGMALFFAFYFPVGNWVVGKIDEKLFSKQH